MEGNPGTSRGHLRPSPTAGWAALYTVDGSCDVTQWVRSAGYPSSLTRLHGRRTLGITKGDRPALGGGKGPQPARGTTEMTALLAAQGSVPAACMPPPRSSLRIAGESRREKPHAQVCVSDWPGRSRADGHRGSGAAVDWIAQAAGTPALDDWAQPHFAVARSFKGRLVSRRRRSCLQRGRWPNRKATEAPHSHAWVCGCLWTGGHYSPLKRHVLARIWRNTSEQCAFVAEKALHLQCAAPWAIRDLANANSRSRGGDPLSSVSGSNTL
jgi:hypothetical protein